MQRWFAIAGLAPLIAAATANAQSTHPAEFRHFSPAERHGRAINLRLTREPGFDPLTPATTGIAAETEVVPNARIGFHLMTVSRPRLGPEWRTDGRSTRSRKPAVSFTFRF